MPTPKLGLYVDFDFITPEEELEAADFTLLNKVFFQKRRYELVMQRDNLRPDFDRPNDYFFAKAQLDARIDQLTELIQTTPELSGTSTVEG